MYVLIFNESIWMLSIMCQFNYMPKTLINNIVVGQLINYLTKKSILS